MGSLTSPTGEDTGDGTYGSYLGCLAYCRCHSKESTFSSVIIRPWVLVRPGLEPSTSRTTVWYPTKWGNQAAGVLSSQSTSNNRAINICLTRLYDLSTVLHLYPRAAVVKVKSAPIVIERTEGSSALISGFCSMKRLGVFLLPLDGITSPSQVTSQHFVRLTVKQFAGLYTWVERGTVRVKCFA